MLVVIFFRRCGFNLFVVEEKDWFFKIEIGRNEK